MERDLEGLRRGQFDVVVVGGGILGSWIAWEASHRGYSVGLVERGDFASGTTSSSGKVLHGGIRYLQGPHPGLLREALREQRLLATMAPSLVRPLTFLVPARDSSLPRQLLLRAGALTWRGIRATAGRLEHLPTTVFVSERDRRNFAEVRGRLGWPAAVAYGDLQVRSPERLVIAILRAAADRGAKIANYLEADELCVTGDDVSGVRVRDRLEGDEFSISADQVVNAAGAWAPGIEASTGASNLAHTRFAKGTHVVLDRPEPPIAMALPVSDRPGGRGEGGGTRRVFVMPWEGRTLVGATYSPFQGSPENCRPERTEISALLSTIDRQWPGLALSDSNMLFAYSGLYPLFDREPAEDGSFEASAHSRVVDHAETNGLSGLVSAVAVKLTTARALAEDVVELLQSKLDRGREPPPSRLQESLAHAGLTPLNSGLDPSEVLESQVLLREIVATAVHDEMARTLGDVALRRTWLGHMGTENGRWIEVTVDEMGKHLGWSAARKTRERTALEERMTVHESGRTKEDRDGRPG